MKNYVTTDKQLIFLVMVNAAIVVLATAWSHGQFISAYNLQSMAGQIPEIGFLAIGVMLAMVSGQGGIDLSGAAMANLAGIVAGLVTPILYSAAVHPVAYTIVFAGIAIFSGTAGGLANGLLIAKAGLTPILATLGTQLLFTGIAVALTNGSTLRLGYVEPLSAIGNSAVLGIPISFWLFMVVITGLSWFLKHSAFGTQLYLMGTNRKAAFYAGIPQVRMLVATYAASGALAALAGVIISSRTASVKWDYGSSYLLIAILIAVMAGIKPEGGYGRAICLLFSATALQLLGSAFNLMDLSNFFKDCAWGLLLLLFLASSKFNFSSYRLR